MEKLKERYKKMFGEEFPEKPLTLHERWARESQESYYKKISQ